MSPEMELLDQLGGQSEPYMLMEPFVFEEDRARTLRSIEKMQSEGLITLSIDGQQVEGWRLSAWRRAPDDLATAAVLEGARLSLTDYGVKWLTHGP